MVTVSIILVLSSIGIPVYKGYITNAKIELGKQNLNNIFLAQSNYFFENNEYYFSGSTCDNHNSLITKFLFGEQNLIATDNFNFCIIKLNNGYKAIATEKKGKTQITIDHLNNIYIKTNDQ